MPGTLAVRLTADALRQVRGGHPWVYADSIVATGDGAPGDLAVVFDERRRFAAIGLFDPASPIRIKVLHRGTPTTIDGAWWSARVADALARRAELAADPATTGYRVVHGENDGLPGLVVDRYDRTAVVKLYSAALVPHLVAITTAVTTALEPERIVARASRLVAPSLEAPLADGVTIAGPPPAGPVPYLEHALHLDADVVKGQKTGAFLDQRDNRRLVGRHAAGARVLDVFACTGGFALRAAAGGAASVHLVDQSTAALAAAQRAAAANRGRRPVAACRWTSEVGDAFDVLARLGADRRQFDIVVIDPPSFANDRASVTTALRAYARLTTLALAVVAPGGLLFQASCSSRVATDEFVNAIAAAGTRAGRPLHVLARTGQPLDHPVGFPQGAYLKAVLARPAGNGPATTLPRRARRVADEGVPAGRVRRGGRPRRLPRS